MAWKNRARSEWVLSLLDVGETDRVLEVGFGSGRDLERVHRLASEGLAAGIDHSTEMVRMARRRSMAAILAGRSDIREASADCIPFSPETFTKVFAINSVQFWPDRRAAFDEISRVLRPGGLVAIALQPRGASTHELAMENGRSLVAELTEAGFDYVRLETAELGKTTTVCALGSKQS
jgi:ubiquinone/menaquinone biosynthesis C-methylase UbiE